jgi:copper chaperone CopZ
MKIAIEGMHSQGCVVKVRNALQRVTGVHVREVSIGSAIVEADQAQVATLYDAIRKAGYTPYATA